MQIEVRGQGSGGHPVRFLTFFGCDHGGWTPCGFVRFLCGDHEGLLGERRRERGGGVLVQYMVLVLSVRTSTISVNLISSVPVPVGPDSHGKYQYGTSTSTHHKSTY
jgi:hypothetical protein